jgi:hypothetical protein
MLVSLHSQRKTGYKNRLHVLISDHIHQIPVVATLVHNLVLLLHFLSSGTGTTTSSSCIHVSVFVSSRIGRLNYCICMATQQLYKFSQAVCPDCGLAAEVSQALV